MIDIIKRQGSIAEKINAERAAAQAAQNAANIEYLAMMMDIEIDNEEMTSDEQEI
ncbi:hypothetical protein [Pseudobutyrivibrio sp.]